MAGFTAASAGVGAVGGAWVGGAWVGGAGGAAGGTLVAPGVGTIGGGVLGAEAGAAGGALVGGGLGAGAGYVIGSIVCSSGNGGGGATNHGNERYGQRNISQQDVDQAIESAKETGQVATKIGKYGTPQNVYNGSNGLTVVVETAGRNAGKVITAWWR